MWRGCVDLFAAGYWHDRRWRVLQLQRAWHGRAPSGRPGRIPGLVGVGYLAEVAISMVTACLDASQPAVWRVHVRRIADASAHRPNRSMSRRASAFPAALQKLATVAGLCRLSERRPVLH